MIAPNGRIIYSFNDLDWSHHVANTLAAGARLAGASPEGLRPNPGGTRFLEPEDAMATAIIDGMIETATLTKSRRNIRIFNPIVFRLADGSRKTIAKAVCDEKVAAHLQPGNRGRFYTYTAVDQRGIHGVRGRGGQCLLQLSEDNETAMMYAAIFGVAITLILLAIGKISFWALFLIGLGVPFYFIYRSTRLAAQAQFEADQSYRAPPAPAAAF